MSLLEKSSSLEVSSQTATFPAKRNTYALGQKVQIECQVDREFMDFDNHMLRLSTVFGASTDALTNPWFASQCVRNLRVKTLGGQQIGNEIVEYRAWAQMVNELSSNSDFNDSYGTGIEGANPIALADGGSTITFGHKFMTHIFAVAEYYPAHFHQGLMIEFDLPTTIAELCYEATSSGDALPATLSFENIEFLVDLKQLKPEIENEMVQLMSQQKFFVDYQEVLVQDNTITESSGTQNFDIVGIDGRVHSVQSFMVKDTDRDGDDESHFSKMSNNGLTQYRYKLGSNYINYESIEVGATNQAEQLYELLKSLDLYTQDRKMTRCGDSALTPALLWTDRFAVGVKVAKAQKDLTQTISSSIDKDRNNLRVELSMTSAAKASCYTCITLDKRLQILPGSVVRTVRS